MKAEEELPLLMIILKKIFVSMMVILILSITLGIGAVGHATYAYTTDDVRHLVSLPQEIKIPFLEKASLTLKAELAEQGYEGIEIQIDYDKFFKSLETKNVRVAADPGISYLQATVAATEIKIDNKSYYFKDASDSLALVKILDNNDISYIREEKQINVKEISKSSDIENEIERVKKEAAEAQKRIIKRQSTSRGTSERIVQTNTNIVSFAIVNYKYISSGYGYRHGKMHTGIDLATDYGTSVYSWKAGIITYAGWNGNYGNFIEITHYDGTISRYAHLSKYIVNKGDIVAANQQIGYVGSTGNSTRSSSPLGNKN